MKRIVKLTFLTILFTCLCYLVYFTIVDSLLMGFYIGCMLSGNILLPTLCAVLIYLSLRKSTTLKSKLITILLQSILLSIIYFLSLWIWAVIDVVLYDTFDWKRVITDYKNEFAGFSIAVLIEAILIPLLDNFGNKENSVTPNFDLDPGNS